MGRMKEEYIRRLEAAEPDELYGEFDFHYGDKVVVNRGFYKGITGTIIQYLEGGGIGKPGYLLAVPDLMEDGTSKKAVICYAHELEALV